MKCKTCTEIKACFVVHLVIQMYRVVTKAYLSRGKDGYTMFKNCEILVSGYMFCCFIVLQAQVNVQIVLVRVF